MRRRQQHLVAAAAVAAGAFLVGAGPASAANGDASGIGANVSSPAGNVGLPPTPFVASPPGGSVSIASLTVPGTLSAGVLAVASQATGSGSSSQASVADVSALPGAAPLVATLVSSECTSDAAGASGSSAIAGGSFAGTPLAVAPAPNTAVVVPLVGQVVLNEQQTSGSEIVVRAVHAQVATPLALGADITIATSRCDAGVSVLGVSVAADATQATPTLAG